MTQPDPNLQKAIASFHYHLDHCDQCREFPFNLCAGGA